MKTEEFVRSIFINIVVAPCNRKYVITNECDVMTDDYILQKHTALATHTDEVNNNEIIEKHKKNKKHDKKKKYKVSNEAVR